MTDLYDELGVGRDASPEDIKAAHRRGVKAHHPDRAGGDKAKFQALQLAYDTLSDEEKRKRYDRTGQTGDPQRPDPAEQGLAVLLDGMIDQMLSDGIPLESCDMRSVAIDLIDTKINAIKKQIREHERALGAAGKLLKRFKRKRKAKGADLLRQTLMRKERDIQDAIRRIQDALEVWNRARALLESYEYKWDQAPSATAASSGGFMRFEFQGAPGGFFK